MNVDSVMSRNPETVQPHEVLSVVREKMDRGHFRRMPVVDEEGKLIGIVCDGDLRPHAGYLPTTRVTAAMVEDVVAVTPDEPLDKAVEIMLERKVGGLPVVDANRRVVGILTESDLMRALLSHLRR